MIEPTLGFVMLFVKNPYESAQFYSQLFNIKPIEQLPTFAMFALPNRVMLGLWSRYTAEPRVESFAGASEICFGTKRVDDLYNEWGKQGVTMIQKPTQMDFGRTFVAIDPDGHRIRIHELREES